MIHDDVDKQEVPNETKKVLSHLRQVCVPSPLHSIDRYEIMQAVIDLGIRPHELPCTIDDIRELLSQEEHDRSD